MRLTIILLAALGFAAAPARGDSADHAGAGAVVEALAGEVDRLAPRDALDDEGGVLVDEDAHQRVTSAGASGPAV